MSQPVFPVPQPLRSGSAAGPGPAAISPVQSYDQLKASLGRLSRPMLPRFVGGETPYQVNANNGNRVVQFSIPLTVFSTMPPRFTYNSRAAADEIGFGHGVADIYNPVVSATS